MDVEDIEAFLTLHKQALFSAKKRLGMILHEKCTPPIVMHEEHVQSDDERESALDLETIALSNNVQAERETRNVNEEIEVSHNTSQKEEEEIDSQDANCKTRVAAMLRYGDYCTLGVGDYELQRRHLSRVNSQTLFAQAACCRCTISTRHVHKSVQTDLQNVRVPLIPTHLETITAEVDPFGPATIEACRMHNNRSPIRHRLDQLKADMEEKQQQQPFGILLNRNQTPRERLLSDLKHSYLPTGSSSALYNNGYDCYTDRNGDDMERDRIKREIYQNELRLQIEEKRRLATMREEQERREQELENKRLEQQLLRMQEEQLRDEQRRNRREMMRRNSDDYSAHKQDVHGRFRKYSESESGVANIRKLSSHYSPPVSRRTMTPGASAMYHAAADVSTRYNPSRYVRKNALNRLDSINNSYVPPIAVDLTNHYPPSVSRYDSLSRIDALKQADALSARFDSLTLNDSLSRIQRRHSATQQDLTMMTTRRSPKLQRRSSSGRFDDALPMPLLKAHSPVARELKYSHAVNSSSTSRYNSTDALRRLEDRWQMPSDTNARNLLQHLGVIRKELQRKQCEMEAAVARQRVECVRQPQL